VLPIKNLKHLKADPEKRSVFCQKLKKLKAKSFCPVFLDESGFFHDMPRTHGYSFRGQKCYGQQDWGAKGRTTVIGALL